MTPTEYVYYGTGAIAGIGTLLIAAHKISVFFNRVAEAVGADRNGRTVVERLERVENQLWENGGKSLADRVNKLAKESTETQTDVRFIKDILIQHYGDKKK